MIDLTLAEVGAALGVEPTGDGDIVVTGIAVDSRTVRPGDLFVAIAGEHHDGHDHVAAAIAAGAVAVLAESIVEAPHVLVADPIAALGVLASAVLARLPHVTVIGLTGSSGKTSTKDLLAQVLEPAGPTVAPAGSFNNELGLPLTVLTCTEDTRFLVLEMGARGLGHIAYLCGIARPDVGVELNVGTAHVGEFGGRAAIAEAKAELVGALPATGVAVLNADDPAVAAMADLTAARVVTFGFGQADVRCLELTLDQLARPAFVLEYAGRRASVGLCLSGEHMAANATAAAAVGVALGLDLDDIAAALSQATARSPWRMEVTTTESGVVIVNDAYNANPDSVRAALKALVAMRGQGRTWAVLGEMLELGEESLTEHDAVGRLAVRLDVSRLLAVGEGARAIHMGAAHEGSWGEESAWVPDVDAAVELLVAEVGPGDVVLVKASRGAGLERVANRLIESGELGRGVG